MMEVLVMDSGKRTLFSPKEQISLSTKLRFILSITHIPRLFRICMSCFDRRLSRMLCAKLTWRGRIFLPFVYMIEYLLKQNVAFSCQVF